MIYAVALVLSVGSIVTGSVLAARGRRMDVAEWSVGGRRFGSVMFWFLMVGETFTTFALLGASQGVYVDGAPGYYVLGTVVLTAALGYWIAPRIWRAGRDAGLITEGDYFARRFDAPWLGLILALFGIAALLLYTRVQLTGLALILETLFGGAVSPAWYVVGAGRSLFNRNVYRVVRPQADDARQMLVSRLAVLAVTALAVGFTLLKSETLVNVMVAVYDTVSQLAPALVLSLVWRRVTAAGVLSGLLAGVVCLVVPPVTAALAALVPAGTIAGLPALVVHTLVAIAVSLATRPPSASAISVGLPVPARQDVAHGR
ncbi:MAG: hypothetical protein GEV11_21900 [Streptosporangiales bacterium]|nr:hypothetical protein [Streptosporangiales bacterium]